MEVIKSILTGTLCPWCKENIQDDALFRTELSENKLIQEDKTPSYQIKFSIPEFSYKIKYYKRIIDNDIANYLNTFFKENFDVPENLFLYRFREIKNDIFNLMKYSNSIIKQEKYDLSILISRHADFSTDREHKESTFILHYLITSLIRCYVEIQSQFSQFIKNDDKLTIEDCYTNILQIQTPETTFINTIKTIEIENNKSTNIESATGSNDMSIKDQYIRDKYDIFLDTVRPYINKLDKYVHLTEESQKRLIVKMFEEGIPFSIAMLEFLEYPKLLKERFDFNTKESHYKHIAKALSSTTDTVKGHFLGLRNSNSAKAINYTAHQYTQNVEDFYKILPHK